MKNFISVFTLFLVLASPALAAQTLTITANGLVCDFCARAVEKVFSSNPAVDTVGVDLTTKTITATLKPGQDLSDETVAKMVTDAGYTLKAITREGKP